MIVALVIAAWGPVGDMPHQSIVGHLIAGDPPSGDLVLSTIHRGRPHVRDEVGLPDIAAAPAIALVADVEVALLAAVALLELVVGVEDEAGVPEEVHYQGSGGHRQDEHRLAAAVDQSVPGVQGRGEEAPWYVAPSAFCWTRRPI